MSSTPPRPPRSRRTRRAVRSAGKPPPISPAPAPLSTAASTTRCRTRCAPASWRKSRPHGSRRRSPRSSAASRRWRRWTLPSFGFGLGGFGLGAACAAAFAFLLLSPPGPKQPHRADRRRPHPRDAARPSGGCRIERPAYGKAMVQRPPRLYPAGKGFRRPGFSAAGRPARLSGRTPGRRAGLSARQARHRPFRLAGKGNASPPPETAQRQGYNVVHWTQDGMVFWAVSDVELDQLRNFAELWQQAS